MGDFNEYQIIIGLALIIIVSYGFNLIAHKTNIPSVLMLIVSGYFLNLFVDFDKGRLLDVLPILGNVGLIMIVLEAALDLKLEKSKTKLLTSAFFAAIILLVATSSGIAFLLATYYKVEFIRAMIYAVPLSIMSSAIIIPSVSTLKEHQKEFLIFESAFSDILGIMLFYFIADSIGMAEDKSLGLHIVKNVGLTLFLAPLLGYAIIFLIQRFSGEVKLFLPIATLMLLYAIGKMVFHLSSLVFVLAFGLMINNRKVFFRWKLKKLLIPNGFDRLLKELKLITLEASFVIRTFFFIFFGMSIALEQLNNVMVFALGFAVVAIIYTTRGVYLAVTDRKNITPTIYVAPRGLITVLLFYSIPQELKIISFEPGILLLAIIITSIIMMYGLIKAKPQKGVNFSRLVPRRNNMSEGELERVISDKMFDVKED